MKKLKIIMFLWLCCVLVFMPRQEVWAGAMDKEEAEELSTAEKLEQIVSNVLKIELFYRDEQDEVHVLHAGSGFFIGTGEEAPQHVLTSNNVVSLSEEEKSFLQSSEIKDDNVGIRIVIKQDVTIAASIVTNSEGMGFALLSLEQPMYDRGYMVLNNTMEVIESETEIYSIGIPNQSDAEETAQISRGSLMRVEETEGVSTWIHDSYRNAGYIGGPLVDTEGTVLGINQSDISEEFLCATQIDEVLSVLDALGISYRTTEMEANEKQEEELQLQNAMDSATAPRAPVIAASNDNNDKITLILSIVGAVLFLAGIVILVVLIKTKDKRAEKKRKREEELTVTHAAPIFEKHAGEKGEVVLIRVKTGQREVITQERFMIGKERGRTDFYIGDNSAVSRMHACILKKGDGYFLTEEHATNGTFLNEELLYSGEEKLLKSGDKIRLADEEFEFLA